MLSRVFLIQRGKCCGLKCLMCPYENKHSGLSTIVRHDIWKDLHNWELEALESTSNVLNKKL